MSTTQATQTLRETGHEAAPPQRRARQVQIVMDHTGDARHEFDAADPESLAEAVERFRHLTDSGFRAVALSVGGKPGKLIRDFDPNVERTLFIPQLQGG